MQKWDVKVAATRDECFNADKKVVCRYYAVPKEKGGITFSRNGAEFTELRAVQEKGSDSVMFLAKLPDGQGGHKNDVMSPENWAIMAHNADTLLAFKKALIDGAKARGEAVKTACLNVARGIKGLSATSLKGALKSEGFAEADIDSALATIAQENASKK